MYSLLKKTVANHYSIHSMQRSYRYAMSVDTDVALSREERFLATLIKLASWTPWLKSWRQRYLREQFGQLLPKGEEGIQQYDEHLLHLMTNRVYDMPEICIDVAAKPRFNILVPAFSIEGISAGFFGVFQVGLFLKELGANVRLVMFDNFLWDEAKLRESLSRFPGMEDLFDKLEVDYVGERKSPLIVSPCDTAVATVWYSAYLAEKLQCAIGDGRPFLYLIQDYETRFFPGNSLSALSDRTYRMNYCALISSQTLFAEMTRGGRESRIERRPAIHFNNACSASLLPKVQFMDEKSRQAKKRLVIYSRPEVNRNMFELTALAIITAYKQGLFPTDEWEFYGMGMGNAEIVLDHQAGVFLKQLPRMSLAEYIDLVPAFDLCVSLMASPHPSMLPFDLAGSGAIVVTNTFETKSQAYFSGFTSNIIAAEAHLPSLVNAIADAVSRIDDLDARYAGASFDYPRTWDQTWGQEHRSFIRENFGRHFAITEPVFEGFHVQPTA